MTKPKRRRFFPSDPVLIVLLVMATLAPGPAIPTGGDAEAVLAAAESGSPEDVLFAVMELGSLPPSLEAKAVALLSEASTKALSSNDRVMALQLCQMALQRDPSHRDSLLTCARTSRLLDQYDQAESLMARLRREQPEDGRVLLAAAELAFSQGDWAGARRDAAAALSKGDLDEALRASAETIRDDSVSEITERELRLAEAAELQVRLEEARRAASDPARVAELERQAALTEREDRSTERSTQRAAEQTVRSIATRHRIDVRVPDAPMRIGSVALMPPDSAAVQALGKVVEDELALYPADYLGAAGLRAVYLAGSIGTPTGPAAGVGAGSGFIVLQIAGSGRHRELALAKTLHHEIFHVAQGRPPVIRALSGWGEENPPGFSYARRTLAEQILGGQRAQACFVTAYATTAIVEDQAEVYARLLMNPRQLERAAEENDCLSRKLRRVRTASGSLDSRMNDSFFRGLAEKRAADLS